eukprot:gene3174-5490_t
MDKENVHVTNSQFSTPVRALKRNRESTDILQSLNENTIPLTISDFLDEQEVWSPKKRQKNFKTPELKSILCRQKQEMTINVYNHNSVKSFIELDRPEHKDNVTSLYFHMKNPYSSKTTLEPFEEEEIENYEQDEILTVKVIENSLNNILYIKYINHQIPEQNICKQVVESFTYNAQKVNRRVSLLEIAGEQSLQDYIINTIIEVFQVEKDAKKKIQKDENTQSDFAKLLVEMIKNKKEGKLRCLKKFSQFFSYSATLYDSYLLKLDKMATEEKFSDEMRKIINQCINMTKSLYDIDMIHNDSVYQNIFIEKCDGEIKCRFIDFDISSSFDSQSNTLFLPKNLYFEGKKRTEIGKEEIQQFFDYFYLKKSDSLDDVEYIIPAIKGEETDAENMIVYLLSSKSNQTFYDSILRIILKHC